ncbi:hypothetical protein Ciccas_001314, partial [Cichlidogyrus casuarinus]
MDDIPIPDQPIMYQPRNGSSSGPNNQQTFKSTGYRIREGEAPLARESPSFYDVTDPLISSSSPVKVMRQTNALPAPRNDSSRNNLLFEVPAMGHDINQLKTVAALAAVTGGLVADGQGKGALQ